MSRGYFLVVEGPEGAGKSTLARALAGRFAEAGIEPVMVREPGGTPVAERIRAILLDPEHPIEPVSELMLFLAARADLVARVIAPALAAGRTILADRFQLSTQAYQCGGRGLPASLFRDANRAATGGLEPDLTLVLDLPTGAGFERIARAGQTLDRIEQAGPDFHARVAEVFRRAAGPGVTHLDATQSPEQVLLTAWSEIMKRHPGARGAGQH
ncbi:MAG TPA: dTMP kinase [Gemmatimonadales bacterium]|nr:dTMP kinase [Gemmatimonadales bacterium]